MAGKRSKGAYWNPIVFSKRIRTAVKYKMAVNGWNLSNLSERTGITYSRLSRWFNDKPGGVTAIQIYHILDVVGLEVEILVKNKGDEF
jgi:transcriptional regulator with XRE-family HTH domain